MQVSGMLSLQEDQSGCWCLSCEVKTEIAQRVAKFSGSNYCEDQVSLGWLPQPFLNIKKARGQQRPLVLKVWSLNQWHQHQPETSRKCKRKF